MLQQITFKFVAFTTIIAGGSLCTLTGFAINEQPNICRTYAQFSRYHRHGLVTHLELTDGRVVKTTAQNVRANMYVCLDNADFAHIGK